MRKTHNLLIVDDHEAIIDSVERSIKINFRELNVLRATSGDLAISICEEKEIDLIILDYDLRDMNAIEVIQQLREKGYNESIIIYTMHNEPWLIDLMIKSQVNGIIFKSGRLMEVVEGVNAVLYRKEKYFSRELLTMFLAQAGDKESERAFIYQPTPRERQVINFLSQGYTSKQMSSEMTISQSTVDSIRKNILSKSNCTNVAQLMREAFMKGWIDS